MNKKLLLGVAFLMVLFVGSLTVVNAQAETNVSAPITNPATTNYSYQYGQPVPATANSTSGQTNSVQGSVCKVNGQVVPCEQFGKSMKSFLGWGLGGLLLVLVIALLMLIFWASMLMHAIKNPIEHKPIWILIMLLTGILGAFIYYYAVKKPMTQQIIPVAPNSPISTTNTPPVTPPFPPTTL